MLHFAPRRFLPCSIFKVTILLAFAAQPHAQQPVVQQRFAVRSKGRQVGEEKGGMQKEARDAMEAGEGKGGMQKEGRDAREAAVEAMLRELQVAQRPPSPLHSPRLLTGVEQLVIIKELEQQAKVRFSEARNASQQAAQAIAAAEAATAKVASKVHKSYQAKAVSSVVDRAAAAVLADNVTTAANWILQTTELSGQVGILFEKVIQVAPPDSEAGRGKAAAELMARKAVADVERARRWVVDVKATASAIASAEPEELQEKAINLVKRVVDGEQNAKQLLGLAAGAAAAVGRAAVSVKQRAAREPSPTRIGTRPQTSGLLFARISPDVISLSDAVLSSLLMVSGVTIAVRFVYCKFSTAGEAPLLCR